MCGQIWLRNFRPHFRLVFVGELCLSRLASEWMQKKADLNHFSFMMSSSKLFSFRIVQAPSLRRYNMCDEDKFALTSGSDDCERKFIKFRKFLSDVARKLRHKFLFFLSTTTSKMWRSSFVCWARWKIYGDFYGRKKKKIARRKF